MVVNAPIAHFVFLLHSANFWLYAVSAGLFRAFFVFTVCDTLFYRPYFYLDANAMFYQVKNQEKEQVNYHHTQLINTLNTAGINWKFFIESPFNVNVNQNIEYNLFSYKFFDRVRRGKAKFNALVFGRGSGNVVISDEGDNLFIRQSVISKGLQSAYDTLSDKGVTHYCNVLNQVYDHYKSEGFDEIYMSIIPNPASVIQPQRYNQLIPKLQHLSQNSILRMPIINVYDTFKINPKSYYLRGDTHWNAKGKLLWIDMINSLLLRWNKK